MAAWWVLGVGRICFLLRVPCLRCSDPLLRFTHCSCDRCLMRLRGSFPQVG